MKLILLSMLVLLTAGCANEGTNDATPGSGEITENAEQLEEQDSEELDDTDAFDEESKDDQAEEANEETAEEDASDYNQLKASIVDQFEHARPTDWGENVEGVITQIDTEEKVVALTLDACDGTPDSYDEELIGFLIDEQIPATLFINAQWIQVNEDAFNELAENSLFEIANHGYYHKPLSVDGESAYGIMGTENVEEVFDEIYKNQARIKELTGEAPDYFRSGTAYYDDVAVEIIEALGLKAVNYNVLGDAGGTFNQAQIANAFNLASEGSIFLFHMNKPQSDISAGVKEGVEMLRKQGYDFVQLGEYDDYLK
ncbi:polysaccharide deacetylase [Alkalibacterium sp. AK22]|uniref:polysaccharide deacetylase family protein n=1 Tax=Alkalibacterium sp. AK22 TaxID=1229520 RepID=UPI000447D87B|nr:polysaccharide deacetylase family protein [Alkalibacterium sp. AK22]EXJ23385.1 polysaccharide deacetylase [Alkalibacterium sp. AK22]